MRLFRFNPFVRDLGDKASRIMGGSALGIDIGAASVKVVQLTLRDGVPAVETYGEIDTGPYANQKARKAVTLEWKAQTEAILDLIHEIEATARIGAMSIPLSSTLISVVQLPKRDEEQMRRILPIEAQRYIPVPLDTVILDWVVLNGDEPSDPFARAKADAAVEAQKKQDVMLIGVDKKAADARKQAARAASLVVDAFEVEMFSAVRACRSEQASGPMLLVDIGASSTKLYILDGRGTPVFAHAIPFGGELLTQKIMEALSWPFEKAEDAKRESGFEHHAASSEDENTAMSKALKTGLTPLVDEIKRVIDTARTTDKIDIAGVTLIGGTGLLKGLPEYLSHETGIPALRGDPFSSVRLPMILEDATRESGPRFAVAIGLALRALKR